MEKRLKKERNKLCRRIIIILFAVWVAVSALFCAIRLNMEKTNIQSRELAELSNKMQLLSLGNFDPDFIGQAITHNNDFIDEDDNPDKFDKQFSIMNSRLYYVVADTAKSIVVRYGIKGEDYNPKLIALLNYDKLRESISDTQYKKIARYLNAKRPDGNYYELVCTKFYMENNDVYPLELKVVLVDALDKRFLVDDNIAVFKLKKPQQKPGEVYEDGEVTRNIIPKDFLLHKKYNRDIISTLSPKEQKEIVYFKSTGMFEYIFYATDALNLLETESATKLIKPKNDTWVVQYAVKFNLFDNCKSDLALGLSVFFGFILIITVILCVMIWNTVKQQIIGEQKRLDFTNAIAHDIKTPLFVISGYAYSLKENIDEEERGSYIDKILAQTDSINNLVHRMIEHSKLDSYKMKLNLSEFDLYELIKDSSDSSVTLQDGKEIKITRSGNNVINADKELIKEAALNLIDNAVKYSPADSVIEIKVDNKTLAISNPCENIDKADLKEISKAYVRIDKSRHQKGNGLGLSIVNSILNLHEVKYSIKVKDNVFTFKALFNG